MSEDNPREEEVTGVASEGSSRFAKLNYYGHVALLVLFLFLCLLGISVTAAGGPLVLASALTLAGSLVGVVIMVSVAVQVLVSLEGARQARREG